jgi:UDP-N-acetylmuramyl tripeptide synthase
MGAISAKLAALTVLTSDNPRHEDARAIINHIEAGTRGANYCVIEDRQQAIYQALNDADANDIILIAGKGHEDYQIVGETKHHFSDVEVATEALNNWTGARK